jgi:predicted Zn-dependent protease
MFYEAIALSNRFPGGRKAGTIEIKNSRIVFRYEQTEISWFLNDVEFSFGGAGNQLVFIKNHKQSEITFYTHNKKILKDPEIKGSIYSQENVKKVQKHFQYQWIVWLLVLLLVLSPFVLLFSFRTQIVKKIASKVPVSFEQKAGEQLFNLLSKSYTIVSDSTLNAQFYQIVKPIVNVVNDTAFKFSFYIISDTTVNAFALPGGKVVVNSGLILKSDSWSEIQGVMAHEIAHVTQRHHVRGVINNQGLFFIISSFLGGYSGLIDIVTSYGSKLESLMYSRKFEFEADNTGFKYMNEAGLNPSGMTTFFKKLMEENKSDSTSGFVHMLSTHPATADRINNLELQEKKVTKMNYPKDIIDLKQFQKILKTNLKAK